MNVRIKRLTRHAMYFICLSFYACMCCQNAVAGWLGGWNSETHFTSIDITEATIAGVSECADYKVEGGCLWVTCVAFVCVPGISVRVSHRIPDMVVSVYDKPVLIPANFPGSTTKADLPWLEMRASLVDALPIAIPISYAVYTASGMVVEALYGADGYALMTGAINLLDYFTRTNGDIRGMRKASEKRGNTTTMKDAVVAGNPSATAIFGVIGATPLFCQPSTLPFIPHYVSEADPDWRVAGLTLIDHPLNLDVSFRTLYESAGVLGIIGAEVHQRVGGWTDGFGLIFPIIGEVAQKSDYRAAAVIASRAAMIASGYSSGYVNLPGAVRISIPIPYSHGKGKWDPFDPSMTNGEAANQSSKGWQMIHPKMEDSCHKFGNKLDSFTHDPYAEKDQRTSSGKPRGYGWLLWERYECCSKAGKTFVQKL